jgi:hypothetical protein
MPSVRIGRPRLLWAGVCAVGVIVLAILSAASPASAGKVRATCGVERWTVKTLQDRPRLLAVKKTTIAYLVSRPAPSYLPNTRLPFERHIFRVTAAVTLDRSEDDQDFHLVLSDGRRTMIAESPAPSCTSRATPTRRRQMAQARAAVRLCAKAVVTGVAFFDFRHGQTGVAPNAIELHPVLGFSCSGGSSTPASPSPTSPPPRRNCAASYPTVCIPRRRPTLIAGTSRTGTSRSSTTCRTLTRTTSTAITTGSAASRSRTRATSRLLPSPRGSP